jgi:L-aspartate oxidase
MNKHFDFLVIGSGIAGLSFAINASKLGSVCIITKSNEEESNTKYAQGGVAVVVNDSDSFDKHIQDTLIAGDGLCDEQIVDIVVKEGPERLQEIVNWGIQFDRDDKGFWDLAKEGGHSDYRVLHYKDVTGYEIERALLNSVHQSKNITVLDYHYALEIITEHHLGVELTKKSNDINCFGVYALNINTNEIDIIQAKHTIMASGGAGQIYTATTNPTIATGDGIAMVYRAKGKVRDMEFIQFHPTSLYHPNTSPSFLISEALRGFGAVLKNRTGYAFMKDYDERADLASRDIVARAIDSELKKSGDEFVYLDISHKSKEDILKHFPNIYAHCLSIGIDISKDFIPVVPAAHYICGGILVDEHGRSNINRLYACGECASTGLHGANRLASNSLLEALVFAHRIFKHSAQFFQQESFNEHIPKWNDKNLSLPNENVLVTHNIQELKRLMSDYVGIVRSNFRLERALRRLYLLYEETEHFYKNSKVSVELCQLRNLIQVSYIVVKSAMLRQESRGLHYNTDYPYKNENEKISTII